MKNRKSLPKFLNDLKLLGIGAEIGVHHGSFSEHILTEWNGKKLYSIDPWYHQVDSFSVMDKSNVSQAEHDENYQVTKECLKQFKSRSEILRTYSSLAASTFSDGFFDFVYIDARHDYRSVMADLAAWWPKIIIGGILAGHDYKDSCVRSNLVEVKRAVTHFAFQHGVKVMETIEDNIPSWYIFKS